MALGKKSWFEVLMSQDRRRSGRKPVHGLVAYFWDGDEPIAHPVRDISSTGLYLVTEHRWYLGTLVTLTLQRPDSDGEDPERSIRVKSRVVRTGADGVGLAFVLHESRDSPGNEADRKSFERFFQKLERNGFSESHSRQASGMRSR